MNDTVHSLTKFEYATLFIGGSELADALENALLSGEVNESVRRSFYLEKQLLTEDQAMKNACEGYVDPRYQVVFVDATEQNTLQDRVTSIRQIKERCPTSEIVVLIAPKTEYHLVKLLQAGAWYFIETPVHASRLATILVRVVAFREADSLIRTDGLTGLYNRAFFEDALRDQVARLQHDIGGQRSGRHAPMSLLVADLDHLHDAFGNERSAREMFLREIGRTFRRLYRLTDIVARIGGDEFGALLIGVNYTLALMRGEILRKETAKIPLLEGVATRPTVSVGVVTHPSFFDDPREMYWHARRALGRAKASGGNAVFGFDAHGTPMPFAELGS
jgi:diguanylate cyclase (GGDEF)-like protein